MTNYSRIHPLFRQNKGKFLLLFLCFFQFSCSEQPSVHLGFVGGLTGRVADLGIAGRDGVILAVEKTNKSGGIQGRSIKLHIKDDQQNPDTANAAIMELATLDVDAIIGHMTSSMSIIGAPVASKQQILMISPTTSTNELTAIDDYFYRVYPASGNIAGKLAEHAFSTRNYKTVSVVYDQRNRSHTEGWYFSFKKAYEKLGGKILNVETFVSGSNVNFLNIADKLKNIPSDTIFIIANAMDTAMLCQQLAKLGSTIPILTSEWSATDVILKFGGKTVEGMEFFRSFDNDNTNPTYLIFKQAFIKRFGREPGFASAHGYDAAMIIIAALQKNDDSTQLKQTIAKINTFTGLQGNISFDKFGDVHRSFVLKTVRQGKFKTSLIK